MGKTRRLRNAPPINDKENLAAHNRESRPWDNQASHSKLPKLPTPQPIRPPPHRSPSDERFVPLLRPSNFYSPVSADQTTSTTMPPASRRKGDRLPNPNFAPVATADFIGAADKRQRPLRPAIDPPRGLSVSDRMRMFEKADESVRERTSARILRNSPFRGALEAFGGAVHDIETSSSKSSESVERESTSIPPESVPKLRTKIGNREVTPLVGVPKPPPLVGLPIPQALKTESLPKAAHPAGAGRTRGSIRVDKAERSDSIEESPLPAPNHNLERTGYESLSSEDTFRDVASEKKDLQSSSKENEGLSSAKHVDLLEIPEIEQLEVSDAPMDLEDPELMPRFSYRNSIRVPTANTSDDKNESTLRSSFRHSRRGPGRLNGEGNDSLCFLPKSSSFLHFDDDERLAAFGDDTTEAKSESTSKGPSQWTEMSYAEPDSFDTFGTPPAGLKLGPDLKREIGEEEGPRLGSNESEKPSFPMMSFSKKSKGPVEDDEDGALDVPNRYTRRPGAAGALRELQRASVTAGNEIAANLRVMQDRHNAERSDHAAGQEGKVSRVQGDILLRSRILRRWNLRYASIVHQGYFGAVLLLFRSDSRSGIGGAFALKSSKMIALADSTVRKVNNPRKGGNTFTFELKTSQRTYVFACDDEEGRDFWIDNLMSPR